MIKAIDARVITSPSQIVKINGMREIDHIGIHVTDAPHSQKPQETLNYWEKHNGWSIPGYHFLILSDGKVLELRPIDKISNGIKDFNAKTIHICTTGGKDENGKVYDNRTSEQIESQIMLIKRLKELFPKAGVDGHREFFVDKNGNGLIDAVERIKNCPGYDFYEWACNAGLENIITPIGVIYKVAQPIMKGATVKLIQGALGLPQSGRYTNEVANAVRAFQKIKGVTSDGVVGPNTAKLLNVRL